LSSQLLGGAWPSRPNDVVRELSPAGLLARDEVALQLAASSADRMQRMSPGLTRWADVARHRLALLDGRPSVVLQHLLDEPGTALGSLGVHGAPGSSGRELAQICDRSRPV